ncbi:MAG TPA: DUF885 domain-containing protein [Burkholderiaceae bacterium]|nr:DUF885 domain-containing protein [Burkholderiaceae bacterium]
MILTRVPLFCGTATAVGRRVLTTVLASALLAAGCATPLSSPPRDSSLASGRETKSARLAQLMAASDEAFLVRNPVVALRRGDLRFAAQFGEDLSDRYIAAERAAAEDDLQQLATIDRARLTPTEQIAYDTFRWQRHMTLRNQQSQFAALWSRLKLDHFNGWHIGFAYLSSGRSEAPYRTVADYDNGLSRIDGFVAYLDLAVAPCREGIAAGIVQPRFVVERVVEQFDRFIAYGVEESPYYGPVRMLPSEVPAAERERLTRAYVAAIRERLLPAFARAREFLAGEYLRAARKSVGLSQLPGGAEYYDYLVELNTTTTMTPNEIHRLGLSEVARMTRKMERIRQAVGFTGTLAQFFEHIRTDPRFKPASAEALGDGHRAIGERVEATMPRLFSRRPRARLDIRPTPDYAAPTAAAAHYDGLEPRTSDRLHARAFIAQPHGRHSRGRALYRLAGAGAVLQDRGADNRAAPRASRIFAWREIRHPRIPRQGARYGRGADGSTAGKDRTLDCGAQAAVAAWLRA